MEKSVPGDESHVEYKQRHDAPVKSHAHEEDIPGTVYLQAEEGERTIRGQALFPVPTNDPNDPLNWPAWRKTSMLVVTSLYSFISTTVLLGPSTYIAVYAKQFDVTPNRASELTNFCNLAFGLCSIFWVPAYLKFGRRPVMLSSMVIFLCSLAGATQCKSFNSLMALRVIQGLSSGVCEALPVQLVNDIFFLNERGTRLAYYTVCLCLGGGLGPLAAGYMLSGGNDWTLFFWVEFAFVGALLVAAFFIIEESSYERPTIDATQDSAEAKGEVGYASDDSVPSRRSYMSTLRPYSGITPNADVIGTLLRSFSYFLVPPVIWVITTYGIYIGLAGLAVNFTFPLIITEPPYSWSSTNTGLINVGNAVGYLLALPFSATSDMLAARLTKRNHFIREAEFRLGVMLPAMLIAPAGLLLYGFTAARTLHWFGFFAGDAMITFSAYFYFTFTLAYAVDSHQASASEMLIAMNVGKNSVAFGLNYGLLDWIRTLGYIRMLSIAFTIILLANNAAVLVFMAFGKRIRRFVAGTWLAALHKHAAKTGDTL